MNLEVGAADRAALLAKECLTLSQEIGDGRLEAWAFNVLGDLPDFRGDLDGAAPHYEHSLRRFREIGE
jgi:hypothetical protein